MCSKHSGLITFFVEEFLSSHDSIGNDDIEMLEREIANTLDMKQKQPPNSPATTTMTLEAPAGPASAAPSALYFTQTAAAPMEAVRASLVID